MKRKILHKNIYKNKFNLKTEKEQKLDLNTLLGKQKNCV
jgi:hypothetical protein